MEIKKDYCQVGTATTNTDKRTKKTYIKLNLDNRWASMIDTNTLASGITLYQVGATYDIYAELPRLAKSRTLIKENKDNYYRRFTYGKGGE